MVLGAQCFCTQLPRAVGLGRHTESPQGAKRSETKFTPEGVPVKIYTRVSSQVTHGVTPRMGENAHCPIPVRLIDVAFILRKKWSSSYAGNSIYWLLRRGPAAQGKGSTMFTPKGVPVKIYTGCQLRGTLDA